jgi:hypothetical protein
MTARPRVHRFWVLPRVGSITHPVAEARGLCDVLFNALTVTCRQRFGGITAVHLRKETGETTTRNWIPNDLVEA